MNCAQSILKSSMGIHVCTSLDRMQLILLSMFYSWCRNWTVKGWPDVNSNGRSPVPDLDS